MYRQKYIKFTTVAKLISTNIYYKLIIFFVSFILTTGLLTAKQNLTMVKKININYNYLLNSSKQDLYMILRKGQPITANKILELHQYFSPNTYGIKIKINPHLNVLDLYINYAFMNDKQKKNLKINRTVNYIDINSSGSNKCVFNFFDMYSKLIRIQNYRASLFHFNNEFKYKKLTLKQNNNMTTLVNFDKIKNPFIKIKKIKFTGNFSIKNKILLSKFISTEQDNKDIISIVKNQGSAGVFLYDKYQHHIYNKNKIIKINKKRNFFKKTFKKNLSKVFSYYIDCGYLDITINNVLFFFNHQKTNLYITINIEEGLRHKVKKFKLEISKNHNNSYSFLKEIIVKGIKNKEYYSKPTILKIKNRIKKFYKDMGYLKSRVTSNTFSDQGYASVSFFVNPGKRYMLRNIKLVGACDSMDIYIRNTLQHNEYTWVSASKIKADKQFMKQTEFLKKIKYKIYPSGDKFNLDIIYTLKNTRNSFFFITANYINKRNFTGRIKIYLNKILNSDRKLTAVFKKKYNTNSYSVRYINPSFILGEMSIGCSVNAKIHKLKIRRYLRHFRHVNNTFKSMFYGKYKIFQSKFLKLGVGSKFLSSKAIPSLYPSRAITSYFLNNGRAHHSYFIFITFINKGIDNTILFPNAGSFNLVKFKYYFKNTHNMTINHCHFYNKIDYYIPIKKSYILRFLGKIAFKKKSGNSFKHNHVQSYKASKLLIRGYKSPRVKFPGFIRKKNGNLLFNINVSIITPTPFISKKKARTSFFLDMGQVFRIEHKNIDKRRSRNNLFKLLKISGGVSFEWKTSYVPVRIILAMPLKISPGDRFKYLTIKIGRR